MDNNGLGVPVAGRKGDWMQLQSGRRFWPLDPRPDEIHIEDIAGALSRICRFGGHCREFYSVAQHSVLVAWSVPKDEFAGLLHDAAEAYLGDVVRPLKLQTGMACYRQAEKKLERVICERFGLKTLMPPSVREWDERLLATEKRDLFPEGGEWRLAYPPEPWRIEPWCPELARLRFLAAFDRLNPARVETAS